MMKRKRFVPILALLLASLMLFAAPVCASSRLLGGVKVTLQRTAGRKSTEELRKQGYTISFGHKTRSNLTKSMTYSAVWLIPDTVLAKGNCILLDGALNIYSLKDLLCVGQVHVESPGLLYSLQDGFLCYLMEDDTVCIGLVEPQYLAKVP